MKVLKFGGTSVANSKSISHVIDILQKNDVANNVIVVSALGGITDLLLDMLAKAVAGEANHKTTIDEIEKRHLEPIKYFIPIDRQSGIISHLKKELNSLEALLEAVSILEEITPKIQDRILSYGELLSLYLIHEILVAQKTDVVLKDARELIMTHKVNNKRVVDYKTTATLTLPFFSECKQKYVLVPGFIASNKHGETTTLGRGGSDHSAAILSHILEADQLEIWTDVSGMYTANPKLVSQAIPIAKLSYHEAMELSHFGAKVIYPPTLQPLIEKEIPIVIKNTFDAEAAGTLVNNKIKTKTLAVVKGISHIDDVALITLEGSGMIGIPGFSKRLFEALYERQINVIMITQASSEHSICLGVKAEDAENAKEAIDLQFEFEISLHKVAPSKVEYDMVNIAVVGDKMKDHQGISGKLFSSLGANNINIRAIAQGASERNISIIIDKINVQKALNTIHESFFELQTKELNLFITGVGNVGSKLLEQIQKQASYLLDNLHLKIKVIALSNSRKMLLNDAAIDLTQWDTALEKSAHTADRDQFFEYVKNLNLRNSIFVDNTANKSIASEYARYLKHNIGVVTCNKIACADTLSNYLNLKQISRQFSSPFLFETNVGAGLPIIDTLNNLIASGDTIIKIQAILSGSLNFVFNNFKKGTNFHDIVLQAKDEGYTEPDPKIDLSGIDVARKILILARESGYSIDISDIENNGFLPEAALNTDNNADFFKALENHKAHFDQLLETAEKNDSRLKYIAELENGKASVGLQEVKADHDFYNLEGSDNIILFYTNRYKKQPLIVKGAGAGAAVTAAGIFGDIIRIGKR